MVAVFHKNLMSLFRHNPPTRDDEVIRLFHNREAELDLALDRLRTLPDADKILAIHGMPRSGKSHFALRLLLRLKEAGLPYSVLRCNANSRGRARALLEELFFKALKYIDDAKEGAPAEQAPHFDEYREYLARFESVVGRDSAEFTLERTNTSASQSDAGAKLLLPPFELHALSRSEAREAQLDRVLQKSLSERELAELLRYAFDLLALLRPEQRLLLFVDDLDLLDRGQPGAPLEADRLQEALKLLCEPPTLLDRSATLVLVTMRSDGFTDRDKDFEDFVAIRLLDPEQHVAIYERHIQQFHAGEPIFTPQAIDWLEARSGGQVGMFLRRCREIFDFFYKRLAIGTLIDEGHIKEYVRKDVKDLLRDESCGPVMLDVQKAVLAGQLDIELTSEPGLLLHRVLSPSLGKNIYRINPLYRDALVERKAGS